MHPSHIAIRNPIFIFIIVVVISLWGYVSYRQIPREAAPDIQIPLLIVTIPFPGASPEDVESLITNKAEQELQTIKNLKEIKSTSSEGVSALTLEFTSDFDITEARIKVREKMDMIKPEFPEDAEDYSIIAASNARDYVHLADKVLNHLLELKDDYGGFQVDRLTHSLQTATRAYRDGKDNEYVVCALIHDIGDNLAPANHAEFAATILEPFVSEENFWIVKHHGIFQGYYFFEFLGLDKNMREQFIDNPYYESCKEFCEKYDQNSFDPDYESLDLEFFVPMVKELFRKPKKSIYLNS